MIPISRVREILGTDSPYTTEDLERARAELYALARALKAAAMEQRKHASFPDDRVKALSALSADDLEQVEERAAIAEHDGALTRDQAERFALSRYCDRGGGVN